ncbi:hypothetical protein OJAV_G00114790 [Oryzias javanicus]|uniref:Choline/carnitine acyltransferase domain-containing protein n=1 Tax=Oryzias javanicus TaxID=123683 RepID=A0A437CWU4_ORYJA|nr:hypothetical protein OJAV_G00114790 [Oryzias javanicus]
MRSRASGHRGEAGGAPRVEENDSEEGSREDVQSVAAPGLPEAGAVLLLLRAPAARASSGPDPAGVSEGAGALLPPEELNHTRRMVQEFSRPGGLGPHLQEGLERRARLTKNWITDWWVQWAYLESRQPLPVHSNPAISLPRRDYNDWRSQLVFASKLIAAVLDFRAKLKTAQIPVEYMRGKPMCMELYPLLFSSCRIPGPKHDYVAHYGGGRRSPTHITVVRNYQFFQLEVYNSDGSRDGESDPRSAAEEVQSEDGQRKWHPDSEKAQKYKLNQESVQMIETGLFSVCLDSPVMRISDEKYASRKAAQILHGGGTYSNSGNRWFDKTLQFVIGEDGSWGLLYEQATAEGMPVTTLLHHILEYCENPDPKRAPLVPLPMPKKLYFHIDREIKWDIEQAKQNLDILINDLDVYVFNFKKFGKELPKKHSLSPNSFIQVALQLAYYRVHSEVCPACDIASQRLFRAGRTEYIRSPTNQALKFILAFDDRTVSREAKLELFREAVEAYTVLTEQALNGHGIDNHLLGLKLQAIEEGLSIPKVFMDTAYGLATHWRLRTGQVPANTDSVMCFGPLVPDGYAVCYNPQADHVHFSITAFNCCEDTNAETLSRTVKETLCDLQELLEPPV